MKRKIALSLLLLFACSSAGAVLALLYIRSTAGELGRVREVHRLGQLRQHLILAVQGTQSDLVTVGGDVGPSVDLVVDRMAELERAAAGCGDCHHADATAGRIAGLQRLIGTYRSTLSFYLTASGSPARVAELKHDAAVVAADLLATTDHLAMEAAALAEERSAAAVRRFDQARLILTLTVLLTLVVSVAVAVHLATSVSRPVEALVRGTRALAGGELGVTIEVPDRSELGELAAHFNAMSTALRDGYATLQAEIDERKRAEARLVYDAFHDALTGLPNRALFVDRVQHVIEAGRRHGEQLYAVLFLDLDRFKVVNDSLGHLVGDHLLVAVAQRLSECLRPGDTVARLGGDEFAILLDRIGERADATRVSSRILRALSRPLDVDGHELFASASIGIALSSERYQGPEQALRDADIAMYQAKARGKACAVIFDAEAHGRVVDRLQLEGELRRAAERRDEFLLHYQPIVALRTGKLVGVEALVRWSNAGRGLLHAEEFIGLAEECGAVVAIGDWAFEAACAQLRTWHERVPALAGVSLSVNMSPAQFRRPEFVDGLRRQLRDTGIDPRFLAVEVTEAAILHDVEASAARLGQLHALGLQVHLDDFGSGSSLADLHRFPIDAAKIDRAFVARLPSHRESEEVIRAIVSLAESLDFDVIAEGVETAAQARKLEDLRCRYAQGHHLCMPLAAADLEAWAVAAGSRSVA
jgi:diguanylate cyclase (GGDEF)-like protein